MGQAGVSCLYVYGGFRKYSNCSVYSYVVMLKSNTGNKLKKKIYTQAAIEAVQFCMMGIYHKGNV